jgi:hypothetical protein
VLSKALQEDGYGQTEEGEEVKSQEDEEGEGGEEVRQEVSEEIRKEVTQGRQEVGEEVRKEIRKEIRQDVGEEIREKSCAEKGEEGEEASRSEKGCGCSDERAHVEPGAIMAAARWGDLRQRRKPLRLRLRLRARLFVRQNRGFKAAVFVWLPIRQSPKRVDKTVAKYRFGGRKWNKSLFWLCFLLQESHIVTGKIGGRGKTPKKAATAFGFAFSKTPSVPIVVPGS